MHKTRSNTRQDNAEMNVAENVPEMKYSRKSTQNR